MLLRLLRTRSASVCLQVANLSKTLHDIGAVVSEEFVTYGLNKYDFKQQVPLLSAF